MLRSSLHPASWLRGLLFGFLLLTVPACGFELSMKLQPPSDAPGAFRQEGGAFSPFFSGLYDGEKISGSETVGVLDVACPSQGYFPSLLSEQESFFLPHQITPHLFVEGCLESDGASYITSARLAQSWICQQRKNASGEPGVVLYPSERWAPISDLGSAVADPSPAAGRWGHQVTSLPDGRVVISGGLRGGKLDIFGQFPAFLASLSKADTPFFKEIYLVDLHTPNAALRFQKLGETSRAFHQAFWNGSKLVLMGGRTPSGAAPVEMWDIPAAGVNLGGKTQTPATTGGNDDMRRSFGSVVPILRTVAGSKKVLFEQIGGLSESCAKDANGKCVAIPHTCVFWNPAATPPSPPSGEAFTTQCGGIEDALFFHQTTALPKESEDSRRFLLSGGLVVVAKESAGGPPSGGCADYDESRQACPNPYLILLRISSTGARSVYLTPVPTYRAGGDPFTLESLIGHQTLYLGKFAEGFTSPTTNPTDAHTFLVVGGLSAHGLTARPDFNLFALGYKFSHQAFILQVKDDVFAPIFVPFSVPQGSGNETAQLLLRAFAVGGSALTTSNASLNAVVLGGGFPQDEGLVKSAGTPFVQVSFSNSPGILGVSAGGKALHLRVEKLVTPVSSSKLKPFQAWGAAAGTRTGTGDLVWFGGANQTSDTTVGAAHHAYIYSPGRLGVMSPATGGNCALFNPPPSTP
ncbi:MAG: hypothetical protein H6728_11385 [Myxococcales bacterium]|nr:hypothetical protein [Myxococcales bacterium]